MTKRFSWIPPARTWSAGWPRIVRRHWGDASVGTAGAADPESRLPRDAGGWGGTPSAARILDIWIVVRDFFGVFPVNQGRPGEQGARSATARLSGVAGGAPEEYLLASSGPLSFDRGEVNEKDSSGERVCRVDWCGRACGGGLRPR